MKTNKKHNLRQWICLLIGAIFLAACEKTEIAPGEGQEAYINFYNASDALLQGRLTNGNMIYVNDSVPNETFAQFPQFGSGADDFRQFPTDLFGNSTLGYNLATPRGIDYRRVFWMPIAGGDYRFIFTSAGRVFLQDATVTLLPKTFVTQYLVESPEADDAYRIVTAPVERRGIEGKVRIQVVNLSPDLGNLEVVRANENGDPVTENLPSALPFGNHSAYAEIDTAGTSRTRGQIMLHFRQTGTNNTITTVAVPAIPYSSFTLTFQGFARQTLRRVKTGENTYEEVAVTPNLRVNKRRVY